VFFSEHSVELHSSLYSEVRVYCFACHEHGQKYRF